MKYFVLLVDSSETGNWQELSPEDQQAEMMKHGAFAEACEARAGCAVVGGEALGDGSTATTLRMSDGEQTVTDGPFAEAAEQIGGFYIVEAPDLDTLIDLCRILPRYDMDIRPIMDVAAG